MLYFVMKWLLRMKLSDRDVLRLAALSRAHLRDQHHLRGRLVRRLARRLFPKNKTGKRTFVTEYENGFFLVDINSLVGYSILFKGRHQTILLDMVSKIVSPGNVCIDIGANIGAVTVPMAWAVGPTGKVIAVEPQPVVAQRLRQNLALNNLRNVTVLEAAVGRGDCRTQFYSFPEGAWNQGISCLTATDRATTPIDVQGVSGRTLLKMAGSVCHLIKIDVEGHELAVLRELSDLIAECHPALIFEYELRNWESTGYQIEDAIKMLHSWGYDLYSLDPKLGIAPLKKEVLPKCDVYCVHRSPNISGASIGPSQGHAVNRLDPVLSNKG
jgi:FkbM family methyltransferase